MDKGDSATAPPALEEVLAYIRENRHRERAEVDHALKEAGHSEASRAQAWDRAGEAEWWANRRRLVQYIQENRDRLEISEVDAEIRKSGWDDEIIWDAWYDVLGPPGPWNVGPPFIDAGLG